MATGDFTLYTGVSNRSRGWKSKTTSKIDETPSKSAMTVFRWDGASRSHEPWDGLRKDTELWARNGSCYVHLYERGQSRRGPAFKLPFSLLLEANCQPLIERCMDTSETLPTDGICYTQRQARDEERVDLYIPAPSATDKTTAFHHHLATRNFFAFLVRRSVVGPNLGGALVGLLQRMQIFRDVDVDNFDDLLSYMDEEGYLDCQNQPTHAVAMLRLAEVCQLHSLYTNALAHCAGMSDKLYLVPEYQLLSSRMRKVIRKTRTDMDAALARASGSLGSFLTDELSEAYIGLPAGARAHLERFRTLFHGFFAAKFGYFPPTSDDARTEIFPAEVLHSMTIDFDALYQYLVDESFDMSRCGSFTATGGICALQSVLSFDSQNGYQTQPNPLPLLPDLGPGADSRRGSWFQRPFKANQSSTKTSTYVALLNATNHLRANVLNNSLVRAYRRFEEDTIMSPLKADEQENLTPVDARKVRWILIYAMNQILRQCGLPPDVKCDDSPTYHVCISTMDTPPWEDERLQPSSGQATGSMTVGTPSLTASSGTDSGFTVSPLPESPYGDLKPDVDYFAIAHRADNISNIGTATADVNGSKNASAQRRASRTAHLRRSLMKLTTKSVDTSAKSCKKRTSYHEIVVYGYGNGTNEVTHESPADESYGGPRSPLFGDEPISNTHYMDDHSSDASSDDTIASSVDDSPTTPIDDEDWQAIKTSATCKRSASLPYRRSARTTGHRRPAEQPAVRVKTRPQQKLREHLVPAPLNIKRSQPGDDLTLHMPSPTRSSSAWAEVQRKMEQRATSIVDYSDCVVSFVDDNDDDEVKTEWEQYNDLGGLTECRSTLAPPRPISRAPSLNWRPRSSVAF